MKPNASVSPSRLAAFSQAADRMFGAGTMRSLGRRSLLVLGIASVILGIGTASAEWWVRDQEARTTLTEISKRIGDGPENVNKNIDDLRVQQKVQGEKYDPHKDEETKSKVAAAPDHANKATLQQSRCGGKMSAEQKAICDAIVKLEEERYTFLQDMRKLSVKREDELKRISQERDSIGEWDQGKLQSNTNRLLALMAHQRIDQMNLEMGLATFDDRVRVRKEQQTSVAEGLMDPRKKTLGSQIINGGAQLAVLKGALTVAAQRER